MFLNSAVVVSRTEDTGAPKTHFPVHDDGIMESRAYMVTLQDSSGDKKGRKKKYPHALKSDLKTELGSRRRQH